MVNQIFGYCCISTEEQNLQSQIDLLIQAGVPEENILQEKISGQSMQRPKLNMLLGIFSEEDNNKNNITQNQAVGILREGDCLNV